MIRPAGVLSTMLIVASVPAFGWGCRGHETIALIALKDMTSAHVEATNALLDKYPISIHLSCGADGLPAAARDSTWADDYRATAEGNQTGGWHFLDVPLNSTTADLDKLCSGGCVFNAIRDQIAVFKKNPDSRAGAGALRFIIHFVGDAHQPLHAETNNDRGGNCIPADYLKVHAKRRVDRKSGNISYDPELHSIWDKYIIDAQVQGGSNLAPEKIIAFADALYNKTAAVRSAWANFSLDSDFDGLLLNWIMDAHGLAASVSYEHLVAGARGRNVTAQALAGPDGLASCEDRHFQEKIAKKRVAVNAAYVDAAEPVIETQLEKAGIRLARILDQLWDGVRP